MIKSQVRTIEDFLSIKKKLINTKQSFEYFSSGSINFIKTSEREWKFINSKSNAGHGHHLSRMVKRDINLWLKDNAVEPNKMDYKEQLFCLDNIQRVIGKSVVLIDINDCYWSTIKILGYITEKTYLSGLQKKEWKMGRNASIGSLAKKSQKTVYKNGTRGSGEIIETLREYQYIRNNIISHIYKLFLELRNILGEDFFMFLTDCVVTTVNKRKLVEDFLISRGYRSKYKTIEFDKVDRVIKKVYWYDYSEVKKCKNKYYNYAKHQLI